MRSATRRSARSWAPAASSAATSSTLPRTQAAWRSCGAAPFLPRLVQPGDVLADHREQPEPPAAAALHEARLDQPAELVEDVARPADLLGRLDRERGPEDRQGVQQLALRIVELADAPLERRAQRAALAEGLQRALEAARQGLGLEQAQPARGQLEGQRQPVDPGADRGEGRRVGAVHREARRDLGRTLGEQHARPAREHLLGARAVRRHRERAELEGVLAGDPEDVPARHQQPQGGRAAQHERQVVGGLRGRARRCPAGAAGGGRRSPRRAARRWCRRRPRRGRAPGRSPAARRRRS